MTSIPMLAAFALTALIPAFILCAASFVAAPDAYAVSPIAYAHFDRHLTLASSPAHGGELPLMISVNGAMGTFGHVSYGLFAIEGSLADSDVARIAVCLKPCEVGNDEGLIRVALATAWSDGTTVRYLEFDIWDSPGTLAQARGTCIFANTLSEMPTVELKYAQMEPGVPLTLEIPIRQAFIAEFGFDAVLDGCYLVVEKTSAASEFTLTMELSELSLLEAMK